MRPSSLSNPTDFPIKSYIFQEDDGITAPLVRRNIYQSFPCFYIVPLSHMEIERQDTVVRVDMIPVFEKSEGPEVVEQRPVASASSDVWSRVSVQLLRKRWYFSIYFGVIAFVVGSTLGLGLVALVAKHNHEPLFVLPVDGKTPREGVGLTLSSNVFV